MKASIAVLAFQLFFVLLLGTFASIGSAADVTQVATSPVSNSVPTTSSVPDASNYCLQLSNSTSHFYYYSSSECSPNYNPSYYNTHPSYNYNHNYPYYYNTYYPYNYGSYMYGYGYYPYNYGYYPYYYNGNYYPGYYYNGNYYSETYGSTPTSSPMTYQLTVETNPSGIGTASGAGTYSQGAVASFSIASPIVSEQAGQRYVFTSWSGDFSGTSPSGTITIDSAKTVVANYELQNYLDVSANPQGIVSVTGAGWYPAGASATIGSVPMTIPGAQGTQYVFQGWTIDAVPASGNALSITMDTPHSVVAQYKTQYLLTISSEYGTTQGTGWYGAGSSATFSVTPRVDTSFGVSQIFNRWTGDFQSTEPTGTIKMDAPASIVAVWSTDSTVLYATIAVAIGAVFVLGVGLVALAVARGRKAKTSSSTPASSHGATENK
jgi:hypothetical protein